MDKLVEYLKAGKGDCTVTEEIQTERWIKVIWYVPLVQLFTFVMTLVPPTSPSIIQQCTDSGGATIPRPSTHSTLNLLLVFLVLLDKYQLSCNIYPCFAFGLEHQSSSPFRSLGFYHLARSPFGSRANKQELLLELDHHRHPSQDQPILRILSSSPTPMLHRHGGSSRRRPSERNDSPRRYRREIDQAMYRCQDWIT